MEDAVKVGKKMMAERMFMRNGATFTFYFFKSVEEGPHTIFYNKEGLRIGHVKDDEVAASVAVASIPAEIVKDYPAGTCIQAGYKF